MAKFTKHQIETAVLVLMETDLVKKWAEGELKAYGVDKDPSVREKFFAKQRRQVAEKIISSALKA